MSKLLKIKGYAEQTCGGYLTVNQKCIIIYKNV